MGTPTPTAVAAPSLLPSWGLAGWTVYLFLVALGVVLLYLLVYGGRLLVGAWAARLTTARGADLYVHPRTLKPHGVGTVVTSPGQVSREEQGVLVARALARVLQQGVPGDVALRELYPPPSSPPALEGEVVHPSQK